MISDGLVEVGYAASGTLVSSMPVEEAARSLPASPKTPAPVGAAREGVVVLEMLLLVVDIAWIVLDRVPVVVELVREAPKVDVAMDAARVVLKGPFIVLLAKVVLAELFVVTVGDDDVEMVLPAELENVVESPELEIEVDVVLSPIGEKTLNVARVVAEVLPDDDIVNEDRVLDDVCVVDDEENEEVEESELLAGVVVPTGVLVDGVLVEDGLAAAEVVGPEVVLLVVVLPTLEMVGTCEVVPSVLLEIGL